MRFARSETGIAAPDRIESKLVGDERALIVQTCRRSRFEPGISFCRPDVVSAWPIQAGGPRSSKRELEAPSLDDVEAGLPFVHLGG